MWLGRTDRQTQAITLSRIPARQTPRSLAPLGGVSAVCVQLLVDGLASAAGDPSPRQRERRSREQAGAPLAPGRPPGSP